MNRTPLYMCLAPAVLATAIAACKSTEPPAQENLPAASAPPVVTPEPKPAPTPTPDPGPPEVMEKADADMKAVMDELTALGGKPIETLTPEEARQQPTPADAVKKLLAKQGKPTDPEMVGKIEEVSIPVKGGKIAARVYRPKEGKAPFPVVVYFHGGGFVIATNDTYDASARALANGSGAMVISPEYRKAPEHKFPTAHEDAFAAYQWITKNVGKLGGDAKRIALAGESAGGNLALATAMAVRDDGKIGQPKHMLLVYPVASPKTDTPSYLANANAKPLNKPMMKWFTDHYFTGATDGTDPRINLVAARLGDLPPATIINAEIDPLTSDGEMLAEALKAAKVEVEQKTYEGVTHEFFGMGAVVGDAKDAMEMGTEALEKALEKKK